MKLYLTIIAVLLLVVGCAPVKENATIAVTFYPLLDLTQAVVGNTASAYSVVPVGSEPHSFLATPKDIERLARAQAFIGLGVGFEALEDQLASGSGLKPIIASTSIALMDHEEEGHEEHHEEEQEEHHEDEAHEHEEEVHEEHHEEEQEEHHEDEAHEHEEAHHDEHDHGGLDPHVWLSPQNMMRMTDTVTAALSAQSPEHKETYAANAVAFKAELDALDASFKEGLANCGKNTVMVNHNAYAYLAEAYGFTVISIAGLSPEAEPTPQQIAHLIEEAREHELQYIFYEEAVDPRIARTIAREANAQVLVLDPVEIAKEGETYFSRMRANLKNLRIAMECQ